MENFNLDWIKWYVTWHMNCYVLNFALLMDDPQCWFHCIDNDLLTTWCWYGIWLLKKTFTLVTDLIGFDFDDTETLPIVSTNCIL